MKNIKPIAALIAAVLLIAAVIPACAQKADENIVLSPVRIAPHRFADSWAETCSFESLRAHSVAAVCVRIGSWLGEEDFRSYFAAETARRIVGDAPENFTLSQCGDSFASYNTPFFKYGNEYLVFISKSEQAGSCGEYWFMPFDYLSFFDIVTLPSGEKYAMDRFGLLSETLVRHIRNHADDDALAEEIRRIMIENDGTWEGLGLKVRTAYKLDELASYLARVLSADNSDD